MRTGRPVILVLVLAMASACTSSGQSASPIPPTSALPPATSATSPTPVVPALSSSRISIQPSGTGSLLVHAVYPKTQSNCKHAQTARFAARYPGALSVKSANDGTLSFVVTLPFQTYLDGIAEVPPTWPAAALEAQAVAARSYALAHLDWSGKQGSEVQQPICASTDCQVYGGIQVPPTKGIDRWYKAVQATEGQVLLYGGSPADTVYFSTSNGHTYGNDQVFGSAPLPYLRPVVERDDGASPRSHWRVPIPFHDLATFLTAGGLWPKGARISSARSSGSNVVVTGAGTSTPIDAGTFRDAVNTWAPCLEPGRYPTGLLPETIPSDWYRVGSSATSAIAIARGWGHGVGMVQWGAYGKARRGLSASDILASYYGGLRPERHPEPGLIHVRVASGLTAIRVRPSGTGATVDGEPVTGRVTIAGGDGLEVSTGT